MRLDDEEKQRTWFCMVIQYVGVVSVSSAMLVGDFVYL